MKPKLELTPEAALERKILAKQAVYQTVSRILTKRDLEVVMDGHPNNPIPAWTDGKKITINTSLVNGEDFSSIERLHGLVFHEIAHVLFSPRAKSKLCSWVSNNKMRRTYNLLEDKRVENFLVSKYPSTGKWVAMAMLRWADRLRNPEAAYLILVGRDHGDQEVLKIAKSEFTPQEAVDEIEAISEEYKRLVFPGEYDRAMELITRMHELVGHRMPTTGCGDVATIIVKDSPVKTGDQKDWRDSKNAEEQDSDERDDDQEDEEDSRDDEDDQHDDDEDSYDEDEDDEYYSDDKCACCGADIE